MQKRLYEEEETSFQKQLNGTRELLAKNYLKNTDMSSDDIAFLLGYQEINSFLRAFMTVSAKSQFLKVNFPQNLVSP